MSEMDGHLTFFDGCVRTYGAATRMMTEVWAAEFGKPMGMLSGSPKARFKEALDHFVRAMKDDGGPSGLDRKLRDAAKGDAVLRSLIDDGLSAQGGTLPPDVDDVPPSVFKQAIWDEALARVDGEDEAIDVDLDQFLRDVVKRVMDQMDWKRRINVGENRHFPRMLQWLREVEDESIQDEGIGFHLMNRGGGGRVAEYPTGPHGLKVRIDGDWL